MVGASGPEKSALRRRRTAGLLAAGLLAGSTALAADGYRQRFEALEAKKDHPAAEKLEKAHALDPDDMLVLFNLARTAAELGDRERARGGFEEVIAKSKDRELAREARGELKRLRGKKIKEP